MRIKRVLGSAVGLTAVLAGTALVAPSFIDWNQYREPIRQAVLDQAGYDLSIDGDLSVSFLPVPHLRVSNVTLRAPGQGAGSYLARFARLDVQVAVLPLFSGTVKVSRVDLVQPDIRLSVMPDGHQNWMTDKILEKMSGQEEAAAPEVPLPVPSSPSSGVFLAVDSLQIKDGSLSYSGSSSKDSYNVESIDGDLSMTSLSGPYALDGSFSYRGVPFKVSAQADRQGDDLSTQVRLSHAQSSSTVSFSGVVGVGAHAGVQGQVDVSAKNWGRLLQGMTGAALNVPDLPFSLKGLLTASSRKVTMDSFSGAYGGSSLAGTVTVDLPQESTGKPMLMADVRSDGDVDLRPFLSVLSGTEREKSDSSSGGAPAGKVSSKARDAVPVSFDLPVELDVQGKISSLLLAQEPLKQVSFSLKGDATGLKGTLKAAQIPGQGSFEGTFLHDDHSLLSLRLHLSDPQVFLGRGLGVSLPSPGALDSIKNLELSSDFLFSGSSVEAQNATARWNSGTLSFSGTRYDSRSGGRPLLTLVLGGEGVNLDALTAGQTGGAISAPAGGEKTTPPKKVSNLKADIRGAVEKFSLPFDLDAAVSIGAVKVQGKDLRDLNFNGTISSDLMVVEKLSVGDYGGARFDLHGRADKNLSDVDLSLKAVTRDSAASLSVAGVAPPDLGRPLGAGAMDLSWKGSLESGALNLSTTLWGVTLSGKGSVQDPLGAPQINDLKVSLRAEQAADLIALIQPGLKNRAPLRGAADLSAAVQVSGQAYSFSDIEGRVGQMTAQGQVKADLSGARPALSGALTLGDIPLDAFMGAESPSEGRPSSGAVAGGKAAVRTSGWSSEPLNTDWMRAMDLDFSIAAHSLTYNLWTLSQPSFAVALNHGTLSVRDARAQLFGGTIAAGGQMAAPAAGQSVMMAWQGRMKDVNARSLTNALMGASLNRMDGVVSFDFDLKSAGRSPADLVSGLSGVAHSSGKDVTLNGVDVARLVSWLTTDLKPSTTLENLNGALFGGGATSFATHEGAYPISGGQVTFEKFILDGDQARVSATGGISLPRWSVDSTAVLSVKQPAGVPEVKVTLRGPLNNPTNSLGRGLLEGYVQQKIQERASKLIEKKLGGKLQDLGLGGLIGGGRAAPEPAPAPVPQEAVPADTVPAPAPAPEAPQKVKPEDVLIDVLKGMAK